VVDVPEPAKPSNSIRREGNPVPAHDEILSRAEKETGVKLTSDPEGRMTYGGSSGGAMALTMAWFRTDRYHRVLSYSGHFR